MITLLTTTKDFSEHSGIIQLNAIKSWLSSKFPLEIIIFGRSKGVEKLPSDSRLKIIDKIKQSENGPPFVNHMFAEANNLTHNPVLCYVNADILLPDKFFQTVSILHKKLHKNYLLVGERIDSDVTAELNFITNWETDFVNEYKKSFKIHPPHGSDIFVFPRGQYHLGNMPDLLVGRGAWDNWMIFDGLKNKIKVVDISNTVRVYHQNHDYSHKKIYRADYLDPEVIFNLKNISKGTSGLFNLLACNYVYEKARLKKNYSRGEWRHYIAIQKAFGRYKFLIFISNISSKIRYNIFLQLIFSKGKKIRITELKYGNFNGWFFLPEKYFYPENWKTRYSLLKIFGVDEFELEIQEKSEPDSNTYNAIANCYDLLKKKGKFIISCSIGNPETSNIPVIEKIKKILAEKGISIDSITLSDKDADAKSHLNSKSDTACKIVIIK